ncbi:MAG: DUF2400 domain-containing protein [Ignavibacteriales bacterium]|nr:DUF2400 domain-containing protein [Ignavibacteriales bacterium]
MKRWNLYLRWMVRKDEIDVGLWDFIPKDRLVMPPRYTHLQNWEMFRVDTTEKSLMEGSLRDYRCIEGFLAGRSSSI